MAKTKQTRARRKRRLRRPLPASEVKRKPRPEAGGSQAGRAGGHGRRRRAKPAAEAKPAARRPARRRPRRGRADAPAFAVRQARAGRRGPHQGHVQQHDGDHHRHEGRGDLWGSGRPRRVQGLAQEHGVCRHRGRAGSRAPGRGPWACTRWKCGSRARAPAANPRSAPCSPPG